MLGVGIHTLTVGNSKQFSWCLVVIWTSNELMLSCFYQADQLVEITPNNFNWRLEHSTMWYRKLSCVRRNERKLDELFLKTWKYFDSNRIESKRNQINITILVFILTYQATHVLRTLKFNQSN